MKAFFSGILFLILLPFASANTPSGYSSPVGRSFQLSGTFGELRSGHFHTGIDIKSKYKRVGDAIYSIERGYISRIRISAVGYGNTIYINHPDGHTSVYAHLHQFSDSIKNWVSQLQARHYTFEIDIYLPKGFWTVEKETQIGIMGNSGSSLGVHLHFEIRDTKTQEPINPLLWPFAYLDDHPPQIESVFIYSIDTNYCIRQRRYSCQGKTEERTLDKTLIQSRGETIAFGLETYDPFNRWQNRNGVYHIQLYVDDSLQFEVRMDRLSFADQSKFEHHIDYQSYCEGKTMIHSLFKKSLMELPIYFPKGKTGQVSIAKGEIRRIKIVVQDQREKQSILRFNIRRSQDKELAVEANRLSYQGKLGRISDTAAAIYSKPIHVQEVCLDQPEDWVEALHIDPSCQYVDPPYIVRLAASLIPDSMRSKAYIGDFLHDPPKDLGGYWMEDSLASSLREKAMLGIALDTLAPRIQILKKRIRPGGSIYASILQDGESRYRHIDLRYCVTIGKRYCPHSFDKKRNILQIEIPSDWNEKEEITIQAWDRFSNRSFLSIPKPN